MSNISKFKVGDYVKKIRTLNYNSATKEYFNVGEIRQVTQIGLMIHVKGFTGGNDPDNLELYIPTKLEKVLYNIDKLEQL